MKTSQIFVFLILALLVTLSGTADAQEPLPAYESYFNYIETMPIDAETSYSHEAQGIAHDSGNWFISQNVENVLVSSPKLWKIPKDLNLADTFDCGQFGVQCVNVRGIGGLSQYDHVGDIHHYQYNQSTGFLLLPLERKAKDVPPAIAAFNPINLQYIAHAELHAPQELPQPRNAPWVTVGPDSLLYMTHDDAQGSVWKYQLDWEKLDRDGVMLVQYVDKLQLFDKFGNPLAVGGQGAVFSTSGRLFYATSGSNSYDPERDGIHVFDMDTMQRIARSTVTSSQPFWYPTNWGECEPEGLTIWDLDEDEESSHSGQLHVLLLNNDLLKDNVYVFHYTNKIYVDRGYSGEERGKPTQPFNTVGEAYSMAWDGSLMMIKAGSYSESLTFTKRVELHAVDDTVIIGQ